jgi:hypothetical protein
MDIIVLFNGLGNQMSQYAFYLQKKEINSSTRFLFERKSNVVHNGFELDAVFGIVYKHTLFNRFIYLIYRVAAYKKHKIIVWPIHLIFELVGIKVIDENLEYDFHQAHLSKKNGLRFYVGGWHTEKYFISIKDKVLNTFRFDIKNIGVENSKILKKINSVNSVSLHVRRGDFLDAQNYHVYGSVCTLGYYQKAINDFKKILSNPIFFVFTNDVPWVRENFKGDEFQIVVINSGKNSWRDMFLISNCQHHINSNGSFSWWCAWLDQKPSKIVMVPERFLANKDLKDIYPDDWIKINNY